MPITQDRMLALLAAATEYEYALEQLCRNIEEQYRNVKSGRANPAEILTELATYAQPVFLVKGIVAHAKNIAAERQHFSGSTRNRNRRMAKKMAQRRAEEGVAPRAVRNPDTPRPKFGRRTTAPNPASQAVTLSEQEVFRMAEIAAKLEEEEGKATAPDGALDFGPDTGTDGGFLDLAIMEGFKGNGDGLTPERRAEIEREMDALDKLGLMDTPTDGDEPGEAEK